MMTEQSAFTSSICPLVNVDDGVLVNYGFLTVNSLHCFRWRMVYCCYLQIYVSFITAKTGMNVKFDDCVSLLLHVMETSDGYPT